MSAAVIRFDLLKKQLQSAREAGNYQVIAKLDKQLTDQLSNANMKKLASNPEQLQQLKDLLEWYSSAIEEFTTQRNTLRVELNGRTKNKKAVGSYQQVAFGSAL